MKKQMSICLLFMLLLNLLLLPTFAAGESTVELTEIYREDIALYVTAEAEPGDTVSVVFLKPGKESPAAGSDGDAVMQKAAYLGQAKADDSGQVELCFYLPATTGSYTLRMGNCTNINYRVIPIDPQFFSVAWSDDFQDTYVYPMFWLRPTEIDDGTAVEKAKAALSQLPEGKRFIILGGNSTAHFGQMISENAENYLWWDTGVANVKAYMERFFEAYQEAGGQLDGVVYDMENGLSTWHLGHHNSVVKNAAGEVTGTAAGKYKAIEEDARFETDIKPLLAERDFPFAGGTITYNQETYPDLEAVTLDQLYKVCWYQADPNAYHIWNTVMGNRVDDYIDEATFNVVRQYYPQAVCSNYGSAELDAAQMMTINGHATYRGGDSDRAGTHSSTALYGRMIADKAQYGQTGDVYEKSDFSIMQYELNRIKAIMLSAEDGAIQPWMANPQYIPSGKYMGNTPWYHELFFHVGLCNPDPFLYWGPRYYASDEEAYVMENARIFSELLAELDMLAGYEDKETLVQGIGSWNHHFVLSGMYAGGRNLWRITPDLEVTKQAIVAADEEGSSESVTEGVTGVTRENFCTNRETPTFTIKGVTVTFPEGSIIEYGGTESSYGYWVTTPKGVMPEVSYDSSAFTATGDKLTTGLLLFKSENGMAMTADSETGAYTLPESGGVTVRLDYQNLSGTMQNARLFLAAYGGDTLLHIHTVFEGDIQFGEDGYKLYTLDPLPAGTDRLQLLLWDGTTCLQPLGDAVEIIEETAAQQNQEGNEV